MLGEKGDAVSRQKEHADLKRKREKKEIISTVLTAFSQRKIVSVCAYSSTFIQWSKKRKGCYNQKRCRSFTTIVKPYSHFRTTVG